jgi:hypothetical protein
MKLTSTIATAAAFVALTSSANAEQVELEFAACVAKLDFIIVPQGLSGGPESQMDISFESSPTFDGKSTVELSIRTYSNLPAGTPLSMIAAKVGTNHYGVGIVTSDEVVSATAFQRATYIRFHIKYTSLTNPAGNPVQTLDYFTANTSMQQPCPAVP